MKKAETAPEKSQSFQRLRFRSFRGEIKAPVDSWSGFAFGAGQDEVFIVRVWNTAGVGKYQTHDTVRLFVSTFFKMFGSILRELQQSSPRLEQHLFNVDLVHRLKGR